MTTHPTTTYPSLGDLRVLDAMHPALITCPPDSTLRTIARMMATYRVHAILVTAHGADELPGGNRWGIVSDVDLIRASSHADVDGVEVRALATQPAVSVPSTESLRDVAALMVERGISHAIVVESRSGRPLGVVSTLDVVRALADFPEQSRFH